MSRWTPCKRKEFIRKLKELGFTGPFVGTRHAFMVLGSHRLTIPSNTEYSPAQLRMMMSEVEMILARWIDLDEWNCL